MSKGEKVKLGPDEMEYIKFKETFMSFKNLGNIPELPISKILALNIRGMKPLIDDGEEGLNEIIDKYAKIGENGEKLGKYYDVLDEEQRPKKDSKGEQIRERYDLTKAYNYSWVDVGDDKVTQKAYMDEVDAYLKHIVKYKYITIPSNKLVTVRVPKEYDTNGKKEVKFIEIEKQLIDVLDSKVSANMINLLLDTIVNYIEE